MRIGLLMLSVILTACSGTKQKGSIEATLEEFAANAARKCNTVAQSAAAANEHRCVSEAISRRESFVFVTEVQGLDGVMIVGVAGNNRGNAIVMKYDVQGWDPNSVRPGAEISEDQRLLTRKCVTSRLAVDSAGIWDCVTD